MKTNKLIIYILSLIMVMSLLTPVFTTMVFAADAEEKDSGEDKEAAFEAAKQSYLTEAYPSSQAKLNTMLLYYENDEYAIYGLEETGEVGIKDKTTGQIMLTNPYDAADSMSSDAVKEQLLSQLILTYSDSTGTVVSLNSFDDAAFASADTKQITMVPTRTGVRVEYTIGREAVKYIVPRQIEKEAFEKQVLSYYSDLDDKTQRDIYEYLTAFYILKDPNNPKETPESRDAMKTKWPITEKYAIYVLDPATVNREMIILEGYFLDTAFNDYAKVEEMYEMLDYVDTSAAPALFRFAIEYNLDDFGLEIKLPASSIRYDSSTYTLESVKFLPYFCAGRNENAGFTLVPDGSGTITRFEDIGNKAFTLTGRLYGKDYSFHTISGTTQETMRLPAFGVMETKDVEPYTEEVIVKYGATADVADEVSEDIVEEAAEDVVEETNEAVIEETPVEIETKTGKITQGYVAYLLEGDAMAEITADHGGTVHHYSSVYTTFYPRPTDSYVLEGISTTGSASWTVYSDRRYTGNYTLRIFPITGEDCDYTDMAAEIREFLVENGTFEKMTEEESKSDNVPLYLETFGTIETSQKIAGFPVKMQTPLTTVEQTKDILTELVENGVDNINVKYTGWYNGGLKHTAPAKLKIEKAVGGLEGLKELAAFANENNLGLYPDLDFVYVGSSSTFDGFDFKKHSVKTIDGRSASHRNYSPLYQGFEDFGDMIISPTAMSIFYNDIKDDFAKIGAQGISVATLGSELSSDHNDDYALNREDVKYLISNLLEEMESDNGSVMVSAGNAYALPYVDHVLGVSMDSSLNINTSESIPFVGMVLHGNVEFAGSAINLDGDFEYSMLKAMENGGNLYFILSKDNTSELKQFKEFSKYYAISYDIWKDQLVDTYGKFNEAMKKVKYSYLVEHKTLAPRVVKVGYENGVSFILNYNTHDVNIDGVKVGKLDFADVSNNSEKG